MLSADWSKIMMTFYCFLRPAEIPGFDT